MNSRLEKNELELLREAFLWIKSGIGLPPFDLESFLIEFLEGINSGHNDRVKETIRKHIAVEKVEWLKFKEIYREPKADFYFQRKQELEKMNFCDLLQEVNAVELKNIFQKFFPNERLGRSNKKQLAEKLDTNLFENDKESLKSSIKTGFIRDLDSNIKSLEIESIVQTLMGKTMGKFYLLRRRQQMQDPYVFKSRPYWQMVLSDDLNASESCKKFKNLIKNNTDPFWDEHFPPHESLKCNCSVVSLSERDLKREELK